MPWSGVWASWETALDRALRAADKDERVARREGQRAVRLVLASSPRSGNTWLRYLLAGLYGLQQHAIHDPNAFDWSAVPDDSIVQCHWPPVDPFRAALDAGGFTVVTLARHPCDVLLSILHFATREPETRHWLLGEGGDETRILHRSPTSAEFLEYATSMRARALLAVTPAWWRAGVTRMRYEDLVRDTAGTLEAVATRLGDVRADVHATVRSLTLDQLRPTAQNGHFWRGEPDSWKRLLPHAVADAIAQTHADTFATLGYSHENADPPDPPLAEQRWLEIA